MVRIIKTVKITPDIIKESDLTCTFYMSGTISKDSDEIVEFTYSLPDNTVLNIVGIDNYQEKEGTLVSYTHRIIIGKEGSSTPVGLHALLQTIGSNKISFTLRDSEVFQVTNG